MIQDKRPVAMPLISTKFDISDEDRRALLMNIQTLKPNHEIRLRAIQVN